MFLYEALVGKTYPRPANKGFVVYEYKLNEETKIEMISFFWEAARGRPNFYKFRVSSLNYLDRGEYILDHNSVNISWNNFFNYWDSLRSKIKHKQNLVIAEDIYHAKFLIWKSFVITQDFVLAKHMHNFPSSFYDSIDEKHSFLERINHASNFISYLKYALPFVHTAWQTYFETNMDSYYCTWFTEYVELYD